MAKVVFTQALRRFFPGLDSVSVNADSVKEVVDSLEIQFPGLRGYLLEDNGSLRRHVNIFIGNNLISDKIHLSDSLGQDDEVFILQALSGG